MSELYDLMAQAIYTTASDFFADHSLTPEGQVMGDIEITEGLGYRH